MALKPCRECGTQVSTSAKTCPSCGAKTRRIGFLWVMGVGMASLFSIGLVVNAFQQRNASAPTAEEVAQRAERAAATAGARQLRAMMHNPERFRLESAVAVGDAFCYEYRAENAFGAMRAGEAVMIDGKIRTSTADGFTGLWNRHCAGKTGRDYSAAAR